jgi:hypothetical protein
MNKKNDYLFIYNDTPFVVVKYGLLPASQARSRNDGGGDMYFVLSVANGAFFGLLRNASHSSQ